MSEQSADMSLYAGLVPLVFIGLVITYLIVAFKFWIPAFRANLIRDFQHDCWVAFSRVRKGHADPAWTLRRVSDLKQWTRRRGQNWLGEGLGSMAILHVPMVAISFVVAVLIVSAFAQM